jgi:hypothetical protein
VPTCSANTNNPDCEGKNSRVAASFKGRLSYADSSQLAISFLAMTLSDVVQTNGKQLTEWCP